MKLSFILCVSSAAYATLLDFNSLYSRQDSEDAAAPLFINPPGQPQLPSPAAAEGAARRLGLNLDNIQGDILVGMKKRKELFLFFQIRNKVQFKSSLKRLHPMITTTKQLLNARTQPGTALNLAFSQAGLTFLGVTDDLKDDLFRAGQAADATNIGDPGTGTWVSVFRGKSVHGVALIAADTNGRLNAQLNRIRGIFGNSASVVYTIHGSARPGNQEGHEHFGYLDGISQPAVKGFTENPLPGQTITDPGIFILGEQGDTIERPAWAKGGSFLAFRQMRQLVPEFNQFVIDNALKVPGLTRQENVDLLGARMIGRWKSGAPIDLAPLRDDKNLARDPNRNNNFNFEHPGMDLATNQTNCPFSAHVRKSRPRSDFNPVNTINQIIRAGIPYGPEVTPLETFSKRSSDAPNLERGLAFVSYQSNIGNGFQFIQKNWVDNANFFFGKKVPPGPDPIIGSANGGKKSLNNPRAVSGLDPTNPDRVITIKKDFVIPRGGEYFFSPSLSAILDPIAK